MFKEMLVVFVMGVLGWIYKAIRPPPPKICGSPGGPTVTASRIKLSDGRHLAYKEYGVPKDEANYKIIFVHGFVSCRHDAVVASTLSPDVVESLGVYIVSFDRPGFGESDPNPNQTLKSFALDMEELADQLGLGLKFYVIGNSIGGTMVWTCLNYIPHRLAGAALMAPVINYWWPSFPAKLCKQAYYQQVPQDLWATRVAHHLPWLTYWWNTQKWFPPSTAVARNLDVLSPQDLELIPRMSARRKPYLAHVRQQGDYESLHRVLMISFGAWEFDPMDLKNPFPNNEGSVHLWQGVEDRIVPVTLQRYIAQRLPWIHYHEIPRAGHMFPYADGTFDLVVKVLLNGKK